MVSVMWHHLRVLRGCLNACPGGQVAQSWFVLTNETKTSHPILYPVAFYWIKASLSACWGCELPDASIFYLHSPSHNGSSTRLQLAGSVILVPVCGGDLGCWQSRSWNPLPLWLCCCLWKTSQAMYWVIQLQRPHRVPSVGFRRGLLICTGSNRKHEKAPLIVLLFGLRCRGGVLTKHREVPKHFDTD